MAALVSWSALALASCASMPDAMHAPVASTDPAPVLDVDFPDPQVLVDADGSLVAFATNTRRDGQRLHVQVSRSPDGVHWSAPVDAMPRAPAWAFRERPDIWAPEAIRVGDTYVLYFSARHATRMRPDGRTLCVGAAVAASAAGPYVAQDAPLTCGGEHGVIDASPFLDGGVLWLHVKTDGNCCGVRTEVQALRLEPDGLAIDGEPRTVAGMVNDAPWEGGVVEAPQMLRIDGGYMMVFAGNDYGDARYATGYATCAGPAGPCVDAPGNPLLHSVDGGPVGPGHPGVFRFRDRRWIAYHGWRPAKDGGRRHRAMYISRLDVADDGRLVVGPAINARPTVP